MFFRPGFLRKKETSASGGGGGGDGTVTSVNQALNKDDTETLSGGPVTTSGTLSRTAVDAGADKLVGWDDSADKKIYFTLGTGLSTSGSTLNVTAVGTVTSVNNSVVNDDTQTASGGPVTSSGTLALTAVDAGADKLVFWDDSAGKKVYLSLGTGISITGTTINASGSAITEFRFTADSDTGMDNPAADTIAFTLGGTQTWVMSSVYLTAPDIGAGSGDGNFRIIIGGQGGATSGDGGFLIISGGFALNGKGGDVYVGGADGVGTNKGGGNVNIYPGAATGTGQPGYVNLRAIASELATTAIGGMTLLPSCNGTPTGTPGSIPTGVIPTIIDRANNLIYIYANSAWRTFLAAGANIQFIVNQFLLNVISLADGQAQGEAEAGTLGETMVFGNVMYLKSDGKWWKAKADALATSGSLRLSMCLIAGAADATTRVLIRGRIRANSLFPTMVIGNPMYVSDSVAGEITATKPTTTDFITRGVGWCTDNTDTLYFNASSFHATHV